MQAGILGTSVGDLDEPTVQRGTGPQQALFQRRKEAEYDEILRGPSPFLHKFAAPAVEPCVL